MSNEEQQKASDLVNKWQQYINYLRNWTNDHENPMFAGSSPACYDEWLDNEYEANKAEFDLVERE